MKKRLFWLWMLIIGCLVNLPKTFMRRSALGRPVQDKYDGENFASLQQVEFLAAVNS
nr:hypothetical protein 158p2_00099 [Serratia entomophila]